MHDMAVTQERAVLFDASITVSLDKVLEGTFGSFDEAKPARIGLTPLGATSADEVRHRPSPSPERRTACRLPADVWPHAVPPSSDGSLASTRAQVQWFSLDAPLGVVHPLHAWDEGDDTVVWTPVCRTFDGGPAPENRAHMAEIVLDRRRGTAAG